MRVAALITGLILLIIAGAGYVFPIDDQGQTIPQIDNICQNLIEQFGPLIGSDDQNNCRIINYMKLGVETFGLFGIILLIGGLMIPGKNESNNVESEEYVEDEEDGSLDILNKRYAKGGISKGEFEKIKKDLES